MLLNKTTGNADFGFSRTNQASLEKHYYSGLRISGTDRVVHLKSLPGWLIQVGQRSGKSIVKFLQMALFDPPVHYLPEQSRISW